MSGKVKDFPAYLEKLKTFSELELQTIEDFWPQTIEELVSIIETLSKRQHDYGTCVYASAISAVATHHYFCHVLGLTGFQAGAVDLTFIGRAKQWRRFRFINLEDLLYPQYANDEHFPPWKKLIDENAEWFAEEAYKKLKENNEYAHPNVIAHWKLLSLLKK